MRLFDGDILKEEIKKLNEMLPNLTDEKDKQSIRFGINIIQNIIDNAPTIEITEEMAIDVLHNTGWLYEHDKEMTTGVNDHV